MWWIGSSSTAVTPSEERYASAGSEASPAYVPRSSSRTPGISFVKPFTCTS